MGYYWAATPQPSEQLAAELGLDDEFADRSMAEAWLTDNHTELAHGGIHEISSMRPTGSCTARWASNRKLRPTDLPLPS